MADSRLNSLLERFAQRDRLALARLITLVENRAYLADDQKAALLDALRRVVTDATMLLAELESEAATLPCAVSVMVPEAKTLGTFILTCDLVMSAFPKQPTLAGAVGLDLMSKLLTEVPKAVPSSVPGPVTCVRPLTAWDTIICVPTGTRLLAIVT